MAAKLHKKLKLDVQETAAATVVRVCGSAEMSEAEKLRTQIDELASRETPVIVLDLSEMDFISSSGLGVIISGHLKCRRHNGQIKLVNPTLAVMELLETTRLTKLFSIYKTVDEAIASS
ncbi:MAG: STAS domain-containing protein [Phycisphaerae bacterium]|nr:STAS domain-containing protein [Phycisphaerae bacterium]